MSEVRIRGVVLRAPDTGRVVRFRASTAAVDRHGTIVRPEGIRTEKFARNPVFLWAHDGYGGPGGAPPIDSVIGRVVGWEQSPQAFDVDVEFAPPEANPKAEMAYRLVKAGFLNAVSIGFIPLRWHEEVRGEGEAREVITIYDEVELLEVSLVPVPSNPEAVALARDIARALIRGVVPGDVSEKTAPEDEPWSRPNLEDFTDRGWDELSRDEKVRIARHFAWAPQMPPERYSDLKLPHHRPKDGAVVWRGVVAAMAALLGARGGVDIPEEDRPRVYAHLAFHYAQFGKEPPEFRRYTEEELRALFPEFVADAEATHEVPPPHGADPGAEEDAVRVALAAYLVRRRIINLLREVE